MNFVAIIVPPGNSQMFTSAFILINHWKYCYIWKAPNFFFNVCSLLLILYRTKARLPSGGLHHQGAPYSLWADYFVVQVI